MKTLLSTVALLVLSASHSPVDAQRLSKSPGGPSAGAAASQPLPTSSPEPFTLAALATGATAGGLLLHWRRRRDQ